MPPPCAAGPGRARAKHLTAARRAVAAAPVGFVAGHFLWPNPNAALLRDLPVIEHFELYYQADNIDFLKLLESEGLFADQEGEHGG